MNNHRIIAYIVKLGLGAVLFTLGLLGKVDEYWSGVGGALLIIGAIQLFRQIRYKSSSTYRETVDIEAKDERNRFLGMKAWAWAGYLFVILAAIATITFKLLGEETLMFAAAGSVGLLVLLYWVSYLILRKKY